MRPSRLSAANNVSTSRSDERLRTVAASATAATLLCALLFFFAQNRLALTGGGIALSKSVWLGYALLFWLVLPAIILSDRHTAADLKQPFKWLLILMAARGVAELWMLYYFKNWTPFYGIAHDILCLAMLWAWGLRLCHQESTRQHAPARRWLLVHCFVTGGLFVPEIYYAWYMQAHFTTHGVNPIYFVPDDGNHRVVLGVTAAVDLLATVYLGFFLQNWPHAKPQRTRS